MNWPIQRRVVEGGDIELMVSRHACMVIKPEHADEEERCVSILMEEIMRDMRDYQLGQRVRIKADMRDGVVCSVARGQGHLFMCNTYVVDIDGEVANVQWIELEPLS